MKKLVHFLGYMIPVIPLARSVKNENRRFYVFIEQPLIGIATTPLALIFAEWLLGIHTAFNATFLRNTFEIYLAYQMAQVIRDGVNTDIHVKRHAKIFLNWFYSAVTYIIFTAGDRLAFAQNTSEKAYAYALVTFSLLWPVLSQFLSTVVWTPILFSKFPKKTLLKQLQLSSVNLSSLLKLAKEKVRTLRKISGKDVTDELHDAQWNLRWTQWFHEKKIGTIRYWMIKTGVASLIAVLMTALYFLLRWSVVGLDAGGEGIFLKFWENIFK